MAIPLSSTDMSRLPKSMKLLSMNVIIRGRSSDAMYHQHLSILLYQYIQNFFSHYGVTIHPPSRQASTTDTQILPLMHVSLYGWSLLCCRYKCFCSLSRGSCIYMVFSLELLELDTDCLMHLEGSHYADYMGGTRAGR